MAKNIFWKAFMVILSVMVFMYCGCVTSTIRPNWSEQPLEGSEYSVLGTVTLEKNWFGILGVPLFNLLGISIPSKIGVDLFLIQWGGATYSELLDVAKRQYLGADAVVNVIVDYKETNSLISLLYLKREIKLTGLAIRYNKPKISIPAGPGSPEWRCDCGRFNFSSVNNCQRCGNPRPVTSIPQSANQNFLTTSDSEDCIVLRLTGNVEQVSGTIKSQIIVGDILDKKTIVQLAEGADLVVLYKGLRFVISGASYGSIAELLKI